MPLTIIKDWRRAVHGAALQGPWKKNPSYLITYHLFHHPGPMLFQLSPWSPNKDMQGSASNLGIKVLASSFLIMFLFSMNSSVHTARTWTHP